MDLINKFRLALRQHLTEGVQPHSVILMAVFPGRKPEYESFLKVVGFDKSAGREQGGLGVKGGAERDAMQSRDEFSARSDPDAGHWKVTGIADKGEFGKADPTPWELFMDWLWKALREKGLNPVPYLGFGNTAAPYGKLSPLQKRQRKYGLAAKIPAETDPAVVSKYAFAWPSKQYAGSGKIPGVGFDIKRDITVAISPMGTTVDETAKKFDSIIKSLTPPQGFKIESDLDNYRWSVTVDVDVDEPEGWRDRLTSVNAYKHENREKWNNAISELAGGRTNPLQLAPIVRTFLVVKHGFQPPLSIDVLSSEDFQRAVTIVKNTKLEDIVQFAKETNRLMPSVSQPTVAKDALRSKLSERWNQLVSQIADQGGVEPFVVQVAIADYMTKKAGFPEPFEPDIISPQLLSKAINVANKLTFEDLREFTESVMRSVNRLIK